MDSSWFSCCFVLFVVFILLLQRKKRRKFAAGKMIDRNRILLGKGNEKAVMKELAQRFIGKDVYVKLLEGNADGFIREVTDSGIVIENKHGMQILNLDYVMKIREYPYKNGKRATLWGE